MLFHPNTRYPNKLEILTEYAENVIWSLFELLILPLLGNHFHKVCINVSLSNTLSEALTLLQLYLIAQSQQLNPPVLRTEGFARNPYS